MRHKLAALAPYPSDRPECDLATPVPDKDPTIFAVLHQSPVAVLTPDEVRRIDHSDSSPRSSYTEPPPPKRVTWSSAMIEATTPATITHVHRGSCSPSHQ